MVPGAGAFDQGFAIQRWAAGRSCSASGRHFSLSPVAPARSAERLASIRASAAAGRLDSGVVVAVVDGAGRHVDKKPEACGVGNAVTIHLAPTRRFTRMSIFD
jgi:hypothetical protein